MVRVILRRRGLSQGEQGSAGAGADESADSHSRPPVMIVTECALREARGVSDDQEAGRSGFGRQQLTGRKGGRNRGDARRGKSWAGHGSRIQRRRRHAGDAADHSLHGLGRMVRGLVRRRLASLMARLMAGRGGRRRRRGADRAERQHRQGAEQQQQGLNDLHGVRIGVGSRRRNASARRLLVDKRQTRRVGRSGAAIAQRPLHEHHVAPVVVLPAGRLEHAGVGEAARAVQGD